MEPQRTPRNTKIYFITMKNLRRPEPGEKKTRPRHTPGYARHVKITLSHKHKNNERSTILVWSSSNSFKKISPWWGNIAKSQQNMSKIVDSSLFVYIWTSLIFLIILNLSRKKLNSTLIFAVKFWAESLTYPFLKANWKTTFRSWLYSSMIFKSTSKSKDFCTIISTSSKFLEWSLFGTPSSSSRYLGCPQ